VAVVVAGVDVSRQRWIEVVSCIRLEPDFDRIEFATADLEDCLGSLIRAFQEFVEVWDRAVVQVRSTGPDAVERSGFVVELDISDGPLTSSAQVVTSAARRTRPVRSRTRLRDAVVFRQS
jgi:hypothetical protein